MATIIKLETPLQNEPQKYCTADDIVKITNMDEDGLDEMDINRFVKTASGLISKRLGKRFGKYQVTNDYYPGSFEIDYMGNQLPVNMLKLSNNNLIELNKLVLDGVTVTPSTVDMDEDSIYLTNESEVSYFPTYKPKSVLVEYTFGNYDIDVENIIILLTQTLTSLLIMRTPQGRNLFSKGSSETDFGKAEFSVEDYEESVEGLVNQVKYLFQELGVVKSIDF